VNPDTFEPLDSAGGSAFEDFYRIYAESIAVPEQKSRDQLAAMIERPDYQVLLARRRGQVVGFSVLFLSREESFGLLEYMAVQAAHRSGGIGAELFRRSREVAGEAPLLVEVDSDRSGDRAMNHRRILFYRRLGCRFIEGVSYILPLRSEGPRPEMDLLIHAWPAIDRIPKSPVERWLRTMYRDVYGCPPDDPRIALMLEPVADPVMLR